MTKSKPRPKSKASSRGGSSSSSASKSGAALDDVLRLPFDQYQRYRLVADLFGQLRDESGPPLRVLDVGGRTANLRRFLVDDQVSLVDVEPSDAPGLVLGDGSRLPFADDAFDAVAAFDTLEHVPPAARADFVSECARVARRWVILAGPYEAPEVVAAEQQLERFLKQKLGVEHRYLAEHLRNGLPRRAEVEAQLAAAGAQVRSIGHGNLERWLVLQCLSMYMDYDPSLRGLATSFHAFYNQRLYASDHAEPVYRHAVVAAFAGARLPDATQLFGPPRAPAGTLAGFGELAAELVAFDREREVWRDERDKLRESVRVLEQDLTGHRESLAATRAELERVNGYIDDIEDELADERVGGEVGRGVLLHEIQERAAAMAALQNEREEHQLARATLESDLGEHRKVLAALHRELEETRGVLSAREADLAAHREATQDLRRALEQDRDGQRAVAEDLGRQLEQYRAQAAAQSELEGRLRERIAGQDQAARETQLELERLRAVEDEFRAALAEHHRMLAEHAELFAGRDAEIESLTAELEATRRASDERLAELERLRGELADRWRNLRRGLSLRPRQP